jgi:hypothetical protein
MTSARMCAAAVAVALSMPGAVAGQAPMDGQQHFTGEIKDGCLVLAPSDDYFGDWNRAKARVDATIQGFGGFNTETRTRICADLYPRWKLECLLDQNQDDALFRACYGR